ncbi:aldo/keto reductase family protein [[Mycoplasma] testudinis]|uniref:aldo/keto reductase family protein n=1 Tax=[Mycoplasma] testudinis TaxID=33924 RepID=UPI000697A578|nr:aldo/keto reductase [[Mycoplasma] testudinis]
MNKKIRIGYGTWMNLSTEDLTSCLAVIEKAGYDYIDTAYIYKNEAQIGRALATLAKKGKPVNLPIQSKVWVTQFGDVKGALVKALKKLKKEKLWSYLIHRPHLDMNVNINAWKQLIKCQQLGLVENIGVSNFDKDMVDLLIARTGVKPWCNQIELSVNNFREDRIVYNHNNDIFVQAWSPLGKIKENLKNPLLIKLAKKYKTDVAGILIAFLSSQNISLIVKTIKPERAVSNAKAIKIKLTKTDIESLKVLNKYSNKASETYYDPALEPDLE